MSQMKRYQMFIAGKWVDAENGATFDSYNPATGEPWATIPSASEGDVNRAVESAYAAFRSWSRTHGTQRGRLLRRLGDLLAESSEALGGVETIDTGKLAKETRWQARYTADFFHYYGGLADKIQGETLPVDKPDMFACTVREPLGVVAAIVPWNSQLFLTAIKIGPALAAGNTVVLKASENASAAMLEFGKIFEKAGFPEGVVNIVTGTGEPCGRVLTSHPKVARVSFTGGIPAARQIMRNAAENLAQVSLELGGKSPILVFDDADLESATNGVVAGIFGASGQSCVAGSRLYLQESIADKFLDKLVGRAKDIVIGDPLSETTQMGPLATAAQLSHIEANVAKAIEQGGTVLAGGRRPRDFNNGWFYEPTIIDCPTQDMQIVRTELFGPVLSVLRFKTEAEALEYANDSDYGLAAGIFTRDSARSMRLSQTLHAGIVWTNTYRAVSPMAEFGGFKNSGHGRESGMQAVNDYTRTKTIWINTSSEPMDNPFVMR